MDPADRSGIENRQTDCNRRRCAPFFRAEQRDCIAASARLQSRTVVARAKDRHFLHRLPIGQEWSFLVPSLMIKSTLLVVACIFCVLSLHAQSAPKIEKNPPPLDPKDMDTSVKPQDDFFIYANGGWIKSTEIPPEYSRWGSFNQLVEHNNDALHEIAEK